MEKFFSEGRRRKLPAEAAVESVVFSVSAAPSHLVCCQSTAYSRLISLNVRT